MPEDLPPRIGDLLDDAGRRAGFSLPVETGRLWARWKEIVGPDVAAHARPSSLRDGILRVKADSPAWATEIGYLAEEIRGRANDVMARDLVAEVRIWTGPPGPSDPPDATVRPSFGDAVRRVRTSPSTDDPAAALERARKAWARRSKWRSEVRAAPRENERKSW
jgi:hypothetical protein